MENELGLTPFERDRFEHALLEWPDLLAPLDFGHVRERWHTGKGAFVELSISGPAKPCLAAPRMINPLAFLEIDGVDGGAGFAVWIENGQVDCLEQFAYNGVYPKEVVGYQIL